MYRKFKNKFFEENLNEELLKNYLESNSVYYSKWPSKIKEQFKILMKNTYDTNMEAIETELDKHQEIKDTIDCLFDVKQGLKEMIAPKQENAKQNMEKNSDNLITRLIVGLVTLAVGYGVNRVNKLINEEEIKQFGKKIYNILPNKSKVDKYVKKFLKMFEKKKTNGYREVKIHDLKQQIKKIITKTKNGKLANLGVKDQIKAVLNNQITYAIHAALSLVNLGWSIYE